MRIKRAGLGGKVAAVILFLAAVAAAFSTIMGAVLMYDAGYGRNGTYLNSDSCSVQVKHYQELSVSALCREWELEFGDVSYLDRQRIVQQLEQLRQQLDPANTNFRYQVMSHDGLQELRSNLAQGESLEQATAVRWYAAILMEGDTLLLKQTNVGNYTFDGSFYSYDYASPVASWVPAMESSTGAMTVQQYMQIYASIFEELNEQPMDQKTYQSKLEQLQKEQEQAAQLLVLECGLPEQLSIPDAFQQGEYRFLRGQQALPLMAAGGTAAVLIAVICLIILCLGAGHKRGVEGIHLNVQDQIWYDVYLAGVGMIGVLLVALLDRNLFLWRTSSVWVQIAQVALAAVVPAAALLLALLLTTVTRCKAGVLWSNTLIAKSCRLVRWFFRTLPITWRLVFVFICYQLVKILLMGWMGAASAVFVSVIDVIFLLYLCWWAVNFKRLCRAGEALAAGDLEYRADTQRMPHDLRRHGEDLNNISGGMAHAVQEQMKSERFKAELITNVSHDLKTPLTSIINYVDLLKKTDIQDEKAREYIRVLDNKSQRLKKLTEDLVEASKASTGTLSVNREKLGMIQLINQALGEYEEKLAGRRLQVVAALPETEVYVHADGRHLWRVLDNLLSNCVKYAMEGTRVYMELQRGHGQIVLSVKNISRDALNVPPEQLMERFVRGDQARTTEGSGLGLSIARSLTELQGGVFEISVDGDLFKATVSLPQMV